jgi:cell division protein FtsW
MARRPSDIAPAGPLALPDTGIGRGWEPAVLAATTLLLLLFGLVCLYSASSVLAQRQSLPDYHYVVRQAAGAVLGLVILAGFSRVPYHFWERLAWPMLAATWLLLVVIVLPGTEWLAPERNGARRWIDLGVSVQPSEAAKFTLVVWTAMLAARKHEDFQSLRRGLGPFLVVWIAIALPILAEPDLHSAFVVLVAAGVVVFAAGGRITHFVFLSALAAPILWLQLTVGFRWRRIVEFYTNADPAGAGFQSHQSLIALGSGGITGQGFGQGQQKYGFLPEAHNDFIFSMIGEEWGFVGVLGLVGLYLGLILVGFRVARRALYLFGQLLAVGLTSMIAVQAFLHMAVGLRMVPPTGLALPLVSDGRSNLLVTLLSLGVLLSVARASAEGWESHRRTVGSSSSRGR